MAYWEIILLLALNCWHECPNEPVQGQLAVAQVLLNRSRQCGSTVEHELFRPEQFSWANDRRKNLVLRQRNGDDYAKFAQCMAVAALAYAAPDLTGGANHYHADYITVPYWAKNMTETAHIGVHIFYKGDFSCSDSKAGTMQGSGAAVISTLLAGGDIAAVADDVLVSVMLAAEDVAIASSKCLLTIATYSAPADSAPACPEMLAGAEQARGPP
jgi:hypothetical protein